MKALCSQAEGGLALIGGDGKTLHQCDALPLPGRSDITALATDPAHKDGVAALGERGVIFLQAIAERTI